MSGWRSCLEYRPTKRSYVSMTARGVSDARPLSALMTVGDDGWDDDETLLKRVAEINQLAETMRADPAYQQYIARLVDQIKGEIT
jgi:SRSO17 transposase